MHEQTTVGASAEQQTAPSRVPCDCQEFRDAGSCAHALEYLVGEAMRAHILDTARTRPLVQ